MALADERWLAAAAETAASLLAHHRLFQGFRDQFRRRALAHRIGNDRKRRTDISNRRKIGRLLARIFCRPDLSLQLRHLATGSRHYAPACMQRVYCTRDFLRRVRLSTAPRA